jgi:hypothetical protein
VASDSSIVVVNVRSECWSVAAERIILLEEIINNMIEEIHSKHTGTTQRNQIKLCSGRNCKLNCAEYKGKPIEREEERKEGRIIPPHNTNSGHKTTNIKLIYKVKEQRTGGKPVNHYSLFLVDSSLILSVLYSHY